MKITLLITKGELIVYPEKGIIHHIVKEQMNDQEFKDLLMKGLELYTEYKCNKWLSDDRLSVVFDDKFVKWASSWESKIMRIGWKAWAFLLPEEEKSRNRMIRNIDRISAMGVRAESFDNTESAMAWLEKQ